MAAAWAFVVLAVAPAVGQEERYRERQVLDPQTGAWVDEAAVAAAPEGLLDQARSLLARGQPKAARKLLKKWVQQNPDDERYLEGVFLYGEACFEAGDYWFAYQRYETVVENASGELYHKALRREVDVARAFLAGVKRIVWKFLRIPAYDDGIEILDRVWERAPGTPMGELALRLKSDYYFGHGEMDLAQDEYANLAREYPSGRYVQLAMLRSAEAAAAAFPGIQFDDRPLVNAEERYRQVLATFPEYARRESVAQRLEGIRQLRAEKDLDIARWYERTRRPAAAEYYYRLILKEAPDTLAASAAARRLRALGVAVPAQEGGP